MSVEYIWHKECFPRGMIEQIFSSQQYLAAKQLLDATALKHEALASNIANAETPGYRRVDVSKDFNETFSNVLQSGDKKKMMELEPTLEVDPDAKTFDVNGNNVEIDKELLQVNQNAMAYQFLTQYVSGNINRLKVAITGKTQ